MKNTVLKFYIAAFYLCSTFVMFSQAPGANDTGGNLESTDPPAPIDDYVWFLAIVGIAFVFMKFRAIQSKKIQG
jgi:hypothetical protein